MDATAWDERYRDVDRLWSAGPNLFVEDRLKDRAPGRGLDLAGGEGRNAIWLASLGWDMTLVDFSAEAVRRGQSQTEDVEFVVANALDWEPSGQFDLIVVAYLHLPGPDLEKVVRRACGWLAEGGEVFLIGHDISNLDDGWGGPQYPEILWEVDQLLPWLSELEIVEASVVRRPVETEEGTMFARDTLVRGRRTP